MDDWTDDDVETLQHMDIEDLREVLCAAVVFGADAARRVMDEKYSLSIDLWQAKCMRNSGGLH